MGPSWERRPRVQTHVAKLLDEDANSAQAKRITDTIMRQAVQAERGVRERVQRERQLDVLRAKMGERLDVGKRAPMEVQLPDVAQLAELSAPEQELAISQHFDKQVEAYFDEEPDLGPGPTVDTGEEEEDYEAEEPEWGEAEEESAPVITLGESVKDLDLQSQEQLQEAVDKVQGYWNKRKEVEELTRSLKKVPLAKVTPQRGRGHQAAGYSSGVVAGD